MSSSNKIVRIGIDLQDWVKILYHSIKNCELILRATTKKHWVNKQL